MLICCLLKKKGSLCDISRLIISVSMVPQACWNEKLSQDSYTEPDLKEQSKTTGIILL